MSQSTVSFSLCPQTAATWIQTTNDYNIIMKIIIAVLLSNFSLIKCGPLLYEHVRVCVYANTIVHSLLFWYFFYFDSFFSTVWAFLLCFFSRLSIWFRKNWARFFFFFFFFILFYSNIHAVNLLALFLLWKVKNLKWWSFFFLTFIKCSRNFSNVDRKWKIQLVTHRLILCVLNKVYLR